MDCDVFYGLSDEDPFNFYHVPNVGKRKSRLNGHDKKGQRVRNVDGLLGKDVLESNANGVAKRKFKLHGRRSNNLQR